ncbi:MAG: YceI family protein [Geminicoccaceae bacterium]|nr:YceI family protein [Geminicoccaceae bacterium]
MRHLALIPLLLAFSASAAEWRVDHEASRITFTFTQMGAAVEGTFERFDAAITFDADAPEDASVTATIEVDSLATRNGERDEGMKSADWFDVANHPTATFVSKRFTPAGGDRYDVEGELTIRGRTRSIVLPMTISIDGDRARAAGEATLDRRDFGLGQGDWAGDTVIGFDVPVALTIEAERAP